MIVRLTLAVFIDRASEYGVGQRIALCLDLPAAVNKLVAVLCGVNRVEHDGQAAAGRVLHADRHVDAAGYEAVLLVFNRAGADGYVGHYII